jgi:hypothetical protein
MSAGWGGSSTPQRRAPVMPGLTPAHALRTVIIIQAVKLSKEKIQDTERHGVLQEQLKRGLRQGRGAAKWGC